jgi:hypothetical protein
MTTAPSASADTLLSTYVAEIAAGLRGPCHHRERILAELRDGLDQAVADYTTTGCSTEHAATAAIKQFGDPQSITDAWTTELAVASARRTLAWFLVTGPLVGVWWLLLLHPRPWRSGPIALLAAIPVVPLIALAIAAAAGTVATTGRLMRWLPDLSPSRALAATMTVAVLALLADLVIIGVYVRSDPPTQPLAGIAVAASLVRIVTSVVAIRHATALRQHALRLSERSALKDAAH